MTTSMKKRLSTSAAATVLLAGALLAPLTTQISGVQAASEGLNLGCSSAPQVCLGTLTASAYSALVNTNVTLSVSTDVNIGPTPWYVWITDETGALVKECGSGTVCSVSVSSSSPVVHTYSASIRNGAGQLNVVGLGNPTVVFRPGPCTSDQTGTICLNALTASTTQPAWNQPVTLTAYSSRDVGPTIFYIQIVDNTTGAIVANCSSGTTCAATVVNSGAPHIYTAYLSYESGANTANASTPSISLSWPA